MAELCCLVGMCLGGTTVALFCVRDLGRVAATCDVCLGLAGELGR
jgi:hypothetical protein